LEHNLIGRVRAFESGAAGGVETSADEKEEAADMDSTASYTL